MLVIFILLIALYVCGRLQCLWIICVQIGGTDFAEDNHCVQMIEPELAFADLKDDMACATAYLQYVVCQASLSSFDTCVWILGKF